MTNIVGIDLGTTNSLVAIAPRERPPSVVVNAAGSNLTPSVVLFGADQTLVGGDAKRAAKRSPDDYVEFVKRQMGDPHWQFVDTSDREHRPEEISGLILNKLAADASAMLGSPVKDAVITVPAYFDDIRRKATRDAGTIAGLTVHRLINEPTAAAIAFGVDKLATGVVFVFDLGGGTFDVTVMRAAANEFEVIATEGDRNLGGFDFDNALMLHAVERILAEGGPDVREDPRAEYDLRAQCVEAKHELSTQDRASIYMTLGEKSFTITVTRAEFERITRDLLDRTEVLAEGVLDDAHLTWADVDHLLLVGGSTRMPMVRAMIERISGKQPAAGVNPDEAVALGAAIVAATIEASQRGEPAPVSYSDATSKSMGIVATDVERNYLEYNSIIIPHNHRVPAKEENVYRTLEHHQRRLNVRVTEGDEEALEHTNILAEQMVELPPGLPKGAPLKVVMSYSIDQMINIVVVDLTSNQTLADFEFHHASQLKPDEIQALTAMVAMRSSR